MRCMRAGVRVRKSIPSKERLRLEREQGASPQKRIIPTIKRMEYRGALTAVQEFRATPRHP